MWLGGIILDAAFGGAKALGAVPALETLIEKSARILKQKLARSGRSPRKLLVRSMLVAVIVLPALFGLGLVMNMFVFFHPGATALATLIVAKFIRLKSLWSHIAKRSPNSSGASARGLVRTIVAHMTFHYLAMAILFLVGGFALLLPYCFASQTLEPHENGPSASPYVKPFVWVTAPVFWSGAFVSSLLYAFATLLIPRTDWLQAWSALIKPVAPPFCWPLKILAFSFNWAIDDQAKPPMRWIGPKNGRSRLTSNDLGDALIVTLVVFALSTALLMLPVLLGLLQSFWGY